MTGDIPAAFDTIESAQEFIALLDDSIEEARKDVRSDAAQAANGQERRLEALMLVLYKLDKLSLHVAATRRTLNDLRTLRRLLLEERAAALGVGAGGD
jgi:hypothetical protein